MGSPSVTCAIIKPPFYVGQPCRKKNLSNLLCIST